MQDGSEEDIKRTVVEEIFHMMTQWGWGSAFHKDVGSRDWSSVACTEMQRVACSKPGWMHPENKCPGAILREGDYVFPDDHTYRRPGSPGFKHPLRKFVSECIVYGLLFLHVSRHACIFLTQKFGSGNMQRSQLRLC